MNLIQYEKQTKELSTILGIVIPMLDNRISTELNIESYLVLHYQLTKVKRILADELIPCEEKKQNHVNITETYELGETDRVLLRAVNQIRHTYNNSLSL